MPAAYERIRVTAERWGFSREQVRLWCQAGTVPGAVQPGGPNGEWRIPAGLTLQDRADYLAAQKRPRRTPRRRKIAS